MQEAMILDNTEQLLSLSPYFGARPKWTLMHVAAQSGSKYNIAAGGSSAGSACLYDSKLDFFLFTGADSGTPIYRIEPDKFTAGNVAVTLDTSLVVHLFVEEDSSGRVWGVVNNSSGVDGLYRRDPSVAIPNWTRVIAAANGSNLLMYKKTNGDIYYNDVTAGNWYLLQNGAAGSASVSPPSGLDTSAQPTNEAKWNIDWFRGAHAANTSLITFSPLSGAGSVSAEATPWSGYTAIHDNTAAESLTTFHGYVPYEMFLNARFPTQLDIGPDAWGKTIRLNPTYSLICYKESWIPSTTYPAPFHPRMTFALLNKSTWACKYLGMIDVPNIVQSAGNGILIQTTLQSARLKNNIIDLLFSGPMFIAGASTYMVGLSLASIPLVKLDF